MEEEFPNNSEFRRNSSHLRTMIFNLLPFVDTDVSTIVGALIGAAAVIVGAFIPSLLGWIGRHTTVHRIQDPQDPYLPEALEVYERIPENERDAPRDVVRWLREVQVETQLGNCKLKDYFLAAIVRRQVAAILYAHYYPESQFLFISAVATNKSVPEGRRSAPVFALLRSLAKEKRSGIKGCRGIVFELEYAKAGNRRNRARMHRFHGLAQAFTIEPKEIKIDYVQPRLSLWDSDMQEEKIHLMYSRMRPPHPESTLPRHEVEELLSFVYGEIYGDQFEGDTAKNNAYREYLKSLKEKIVSGLPDQVPIS